MKFARMSLMFAIALSEVSVYANFQSLGGPTKAESGPDPNQMIIIAEDYDASIASEIAALSVGSNVQTLSAPSASGGGSGSSVMFVANFQTQQQLDEFKNSPVASGVIMEVDAPVYLEPIIESDASEFNRRLQGGQSIPWGINKVFEKDGTSQIPWDNDVELPDITKPMCIIDSGYSVAHDDLPDKADNAGINNSWSVDGCGHGTHVAGTIVASNNEVGVVGVFPGAPTKIVKVFANDCRWFYTSGLIKAMEGCVNSGAKIINMSLGGPTPTKGLQKMLDTWYNEKGVLIIASAGNSGNSQKRYPAYFDNVMSVAATDINDNRPRFSTFNDRVDIAAPGVGVQSTVFRSNASVYPYWSGTSMASPHVAGVAFLLWNQYKDCTNDEIRRLLEDTATDKGSEGRDNYYGHGIVNYWAANDKALADGGCLPPTAAPVVPPTAAPVVPPTAAPVVPPTAAPVVPPTAAPVVPPTAAPVVPPTAAPVVPPTAAPVVPPTPFPMEAPCTKYDVTINLKLDKFPGETSWFLTKYNGGKVVASGNSYETGNEYIENYCLDPDCYVFTMKDASGDGLCCDNGNGHYRLTLNDDVIVEGSEFGQNEITPFGTCSDTSPAANSSNHDEKGRL